MPDKLIELPKDVTVVGRSKGRDVLQRPDGSHKLGPVTEQTETRPILGPDESFVGEQPNAYVVQGVGGEHRLIPK